MKRKVGTLIDEGVMRMVKRKAVEENRPLSGIIQEAIVEYVVTGKKDVDARLKAWRRFCGCPLKLPPKALKAIIEADTWER